jgi:group I intron endonuclease
MANWKGKFSGLDQIPNDACGVYCLQCLANGKLYIGSSKNVRNRILRHFTRLRNNKSENPDLQREYNLAGEENFQVAILILCKPDKLLKWEQFYLDTHVPQYNIFGANNLNIFPETVRQKISSTKIGHRISEETKKKISNSMKGRHWKISTDARQGRLGSKMTAETKKKISSALKGRRLSEDHKRKISQSIKGKSLT